MTILDAFCKKLKTLGDGLAYDHKCFLITFKMVTMAARITYEDDKFDDIVSVNHLVFF